MRYPRDHCSIGVTKQIYSAVLSMFNSEAYWIEISLFCDWMKEAKFHGYSGNSPRLTNSILECQTAWKFAFSEKAKIYFFSSETHNPLSNSEWTSNHISDFGFHHAFVYKISWKNYATFNLRVGGSFLKV